MAYRQIDYLERIKIEALYDAGHTPQQIAVHLSRHSSTIYRELARGRYDRLDTYLVYHPAYSADIAQRDRDYKSSGKGPSLKLGSDFVFVEYIEGKILNDRYSPAAALAALAWERPDIATRICIKTLYNYIDQGLFLNVTNKALLRRREHKQGYDKVQRVRTKHPLFASIDERPVWVNQRLEAGHWEMDTVYSSTKKGEVLLVLTERITLKEILMKMKSRTRREVVKALDRLERRFGIAFYTVFKSITVDNGSEFMDYNGMEASCRRKAKRTKIYYCHPYSSWERGSNENANAIIRRFIPKGAKIEGFSTKAIQYIENWMNNCPRKVLGYRSPNILFSEVFENAAGKNIHPFGGRPGVCNVKRLRD
ncbi:MAG: IS30 family transposase [Provencibacterium sp.]|jgi:IS30 family transposase|nr:IS30 family transposase [Provencibacterium sp.]